LAYLSFAIEGVHGVATGELDLCVGDFWATNSRILLLAQTGSFTSAITFDEIGMYALVDNNESLVVAILRFFKPATPRLWLVILGVVTLFMVAIYITEGDPCNPGQVKSVEACMAYVCIEAVQL
jgi:hypothetical protein